ncbi:unnamed protein product, partial [marine sediment metagenome]
LRDAVNTEWTGFAAKGCTAWGIAVEVPLQDGGDFGPYRFMAAACKVSTAIMDPLPDSVTQRVTLEGVNSNLDPVRGGIRMPCIPKSAVDCNTLTQGQVDSLTDFFNAVFKPVWVVSGGKVFVRAIKSTHEFEETEYVGAPSITVSPRVTTRQDRVLNKSQCLPDQVAGPQ